jgi:hypothetical protein
MVESYNTSYYSNFLDRTQEFADSKEKFSHPYLLLTDPVSRCFVGKIWMPILKAGYFFTGAFLIQGSALFSSSLSQKVDDLWYDPISTKNLLKICRFFQKSSQNLAMRHPTDLPLIKYFDRCSISMARHLYIFAKDASLLLKIPKELHNYVNWEFKSSALGEKPTSLLGRAWWWIRRGTQAGSEAFFSVIHAIVGVIQRAFQNFPLENFLFNKVERCLKSVKHYFEDRVKKRLHQQIDRQEGQIRKVVVGKVAEAAFSQLFTSIANVALQYVIGRSVYHLSQKGIFYLSENEKISEGCATGLLYGESILAAYLWIRLMAPTLNGLYADYQIPFDPEASTLRELRTLTGYKHLKNIVQYILHKQHQKLGFGGVDSH